MGSMKAASSVPETSDEFMIPQSKSREIEVDDAADSDDEHEALDLEDMLGVSDDTSMAKLEEELADDGFDSGLLSFLDGIVDVAKKAKQGTGTKKIKQKEVKKMKKAVGK